MFSFLIGVCALLIAGCAAFFSVQGIATLFSGKFVAVCIMAGGLELGKLFASSFLHRYWSVTSYFIKIYLVLAVLILMVITSLGIFGFLMSAYEQSHSKVEIIDVQRESIESKLSLIESESNIIQKRIETLNDIRAVQEKRVEDAGNYKVPREQAYEAINKANEEIRQSQENITNLFSDSEKLKSELLELKMEESKSSDIGTLKYISKTFNTDVNTVVKYFIISIVFVFDPLAIALILAYNVTVKNRSSTHIKDKPTNDVRLEDEVDDIFRKNLIKKDYVNPKYRNSTE